MTRDEALNLLTGGKTGVLNWNRLRSAGLEIPILKGAHLCDADLRQANLRHTNLMAADLRHAHLHRAKLRGANLCGAYLRGAYLCEADLHEADLCGADLYGSIGLTQVQLDSAKGSESTRLPNGLDRPESWSDCDAT